MGRTKDTVTVGEKKFLRDNFAVIINDVFHKFFCTDSI